MTDYGDITVIKPAATTLLVALFSGKLFVIYIIYENLLNNTSSIRNTEQINIESSDNKF